MNGNKPLVPFANEFTERVAGHPSVAYHPYPYPSPLCRVLVKFVIDEILVADSAADDVSSFLVDLGAVDTGATVFDGFDHKPSENIQIWRLETTPGDGDYPDVAKVVWEVRDAFPHVEGKVAPNHVLVPAPYFHDCPWGPPEEHEKLPLPAPALPAVNVTVIDAGYRHVGPIAWRIVDPPDYGEWFDAGKWITETETRRNQPPESLDGLVGHANFVAGVIAQECPNAVIRVLSHDAAFVARDNGDLPIPTEASVARSLWKSLGKDGLTPAAAVINVGFAFATLPNGPVLATVPDTNGPASWTLKVVLDSIENRDKHVIVAPAGNQGCTTRQYPAAFRADGFTNVVGVGSLGRYGRRSDFSNHGPWVAVDVEGENVVSTFIDDWIGTTEEKEPDGSQPSKNFTSGWAMWSGTSFAAPKVAAYTALWTTRGTDPLQAWEAWKDMYDKTPIAVLNPNVNRVP